MLAIAATTHTALIVTFSSASSKVQDSTLAPWKLERITHTLFDHCHGTLGSIFTFIGAKAELLSESPLHVICQIREHVINMFLFDFRFRRSVFDLNLMRNIHVFTRWFRFFIVITVILFKFLLLLILL